MTLVWKMLNKTEKIYIIKGVFKKLAKFILITGALIGLGTILKIEDKLFWFCIGFMSSYAIGWKNDK